MKCFKCEKEIQGQVKYCPRCGTYLGFSDELIQRAIQGDEAAQAELYNRTYSDVYFTILSITKDEDLIMDMVQDTYLTAFRKLEQLKDSDSFCAWLKRIAHNRTLNALRDRRVLHTATTISTETEVVLEIEDDRIESLPEASMDQKETSRLVREVLDALPEDQRIVVGMYYYDQLSVSEIAEELECSENTVKSRLNYGRKKIQGKVLELEKKGTKLYNLAPLSFFIWLLRNLYKQPDEKMFQVIRQKIACDNILNAKKSSNPDKDISDKNGDGKGKTDKKGTDKKSGKKEAPASDESAQKSGNTGNATDSLNQKVATQNSAPVMQAGAAAAKGIKIKLIAGVIAAAVIGGGGGVYYYTNQNKNEATEEKTDTDENTVITETPVETATPEPIATSTPTPSPTPTPEPSPTPEPVKTTKNIIESTIGYPYVGGTTYDVTYHAAIAYQENGSDAGISLSEAPTGVVGAMKKDMDGDGAEELLLAVLKPVDQVFINNGKKDAALYFEVYKEQDGNWTLQGGTSDEDAFRVNITECFPNTKAVWNNGMIVVFEDMKAVFPADPGGSGAIYTYTGNGFSCETNEDAGEIEWPGQEFTAPVENAAQEDVLCQITIPQIYDGGNYGIVSSVYQGTPANVTLEYRDNGTVEAEDVTATGEQNSEMEMQDDGVTEVVDQYDTTEQISTYQEESMLIQEGYVKPQFSTYDEVVKLYRDVIKAGGDYEQMLAAGLTNLEICARAYKDSNDALSRFGYCYIDLDNDGEDELIIGKENYVYEIYSQKDGIKKIYECTNYRASGWITTDNNICFTGIGGAGCNGIYVFKLSDGKKKILEDLTVDTQVNPEDVDKYNQLVDEYTEKMLSLTFTPFSEAQ